MLDEANADSRVRPSDFKILFAFVWKSKDGVAWSRSWRQLTDQTTISRSQVAVSLRRLVMLGYLEPTARGPRQPLSYRLAPGWGRPTTRRLTARAVKKLDPTGEKILPLQSRK